MSQDLLAEFGSFAIQDNGVASHDPSLPTVTNDAKQHSLFQDQENNNQEDAWGNDDDDDDDFGDFEAAEQEVNEEVFGQGQKPEPELSKVARPAPAEKVISAPDFKLSRSAKALSASHPFARNLDVLFDAEDSDEMLEAAEEAGDDDDDFGDFETTTTTVAAAPSTNSFTTRPNISTSKVQSSATFDLLGLDDEVAPQSSQGSKQSSETTKAPPRTTPSIQKSTLQPQVNQPRAAQPQAVRSPPVPEDDFAAWEDFDSVPVEAVKAVQPTSSPIRGPDAGVGDLIKLPIELIGNLSVPSPSRPSPAPSNIPPPSILLSLFPTLFSDTSTHFLHPFAKLSSDQKHTFLTSSAAQTFLKNYLTAAHVLAHIIAGRKNRWKRDKYLAQSMRIGPSVSGRSGGMKLAGLDANESRREDAEVEDVLKVWREQLGRLRSAITGAVAGGAGKKALPVVPEMSTVMPVRIAKQAEGGVVSTAACALCGLKREERVAKVDVEVEDSFGEWWVEKTNMHLGCWNFWEEHKLRLKGR